MIVRFKDSMILCLQDSMIHGLFGYVGCLVDTKKPAVRLACVVLVVVCYQSGMDSIMLCRRLYRLASAHSSLEY